MTPIESIQEVDGKEIDPKEQKPKEGVSVNRMSDIPDSRGDFPVFTTRLPANLSQGGCRWRVKTLTKKLLTQVTESPPTTRLLSKTRTGK